MVELWFRVLKGHPMFDSNRRNYGAVNCVAGVWHFATNILRGPSAAHSVLLLQYYIREQQWRDAAEHWVAYRGELSLSDLTNAEHIRIEQELGEIEKEKKAAAAKAAAVVASSPIDAAVVMTGDLIAGLVKQLMAAVAPKPVPAPAPTADLGAMLAQILAGHGPAFTAAFNAATVPSKPVSTETVKDAAGRTVNKETGMFVS